MIEDIVQDLEFYNEPQQDMMLAPIHEEKQVTEKINPVEEIIKEALPDLAEQQMKEQLDKISAQVQNALFQRIMNEVYPVGTLLFAKDDRSLPAIGTWTERTNFDGRYIRVGGNYGTLGGSNTQTVMFKLPQHTHQSIDNVRPIETDVKIKVKEGSGDDPEVLKSIAQRQETPVTRSAGEENPTQNISIQPEFVELRLFERTA